VDMVLQMGPSDAKERIHAPMFENVGRG